MTTGGTDTSGAGSAAGGGVVDFVAENRPVVGWILAAIGLACFALGGWYFYKGLLPPAAKTPSSEKADAKGDKPLDRPETEKVAVANQLEYVSGGIAGVTGALVGLGLGVSLLAGIPSPSPAARRTDARMTLLLTGGLYGAVFMLASAWFLVLEFNTLVSTIAAGTLPTSKELLGPIVGLLAGVGAVLLGVQPARVEERGNALIRRLIYGANLGLTTLLLIVLLVLANVFVSLRVPNKLDTTEFGLHSLTLSEATKDYVAGLSKTVRVDVILRDNNDAVETDVRRLVGLCQEINPERFVVRNLSVAHNEKDIDELIKKYRQLNINDFGLLFSLEEDDKQATFVSLRDMQDSTPEPGSQGREPKLTFKGEGELVKALLTLTETSSRPKLYFTQGSRELGIDPATAGEGRAANELKAALERTGCQVARLDFEPNATAPKVPDDADIVVVADPLGPLPDKTIAAVRAFMTQPRPNGKKGKLIYLSGAHANPEGTELVATGLEGLLQEFGVQVGNQVIYTIPNSQRSIPASSVMCICDPQREQDRNPIALALSGLAIGLSNVRRVEPAQAHGPNATADRLVTTIPGQWTFLETALLPNPNRAAEELKENQNQELFNKKNVSRGPRGAAAVASTEGTPRVVAFGFGDVFSDQGGRGFQSNPVPTNMFTASVNWLRERPAVANLTSKTYGRFSLNPAADDARLRWLPVGILLASIPAVGFGVWMFRRK
ncbi:Gldg family protein [Fimbriiglobus ruber]|nr:Gldg family protein [Fimbriiglobus ruber]